jgi:hypothetical protein
MAVGDRGSMQDMSQTPEPSTQPTSVPAAPRPAPPAHERVKPPGLYVAAAWVVIVAGIVFILATVFFAGAMVVGFNDHCHYRYHHGMMFGPAGPGGPGGPWGGQWGYGPGGPGMAPPFGPPPGFGPGGPGGPGQSPTTSAPAPVPNAPGTPRP